MIFKIDSRLNISNYVKDVEIWLTQLSRDAISVHEAFTHTDKTPAEVGGYVQAQANLHVTTSAPECFLTILVIPWWKKIAYRNTVAVHSYGKISFNRDFLFKKGRDEHDLKNTVAHEYMHYIGFHHDGDKATPYNLKSVPYAVGALVEAWSRGKS